jgi:hypothetical protein
MSVDELQRQREPFAPPPGWPDPIQTKVWIGYENGYWYALSQDFDVIGQGESASQALLEMGELLRDYLDTCAREGLTYADVRRPVPLWVRARHHAAFLRSKLAGILGRGGDHVVREANYFVPGFC